MSQANLVSRFHAQAMEPDKVLIRLHFMIQWVYRDVMKVVEAINNEFPGSEVVRPLKENYGSMVSLSVCADKAEMVFADLNLGMVSGQSPITSEDVSGETVHFGSPEDAFAYALRNVPSRAFA